MTITDHTTAPRDNHELEQEFDLDAWIDAAQPPEARVPLRLNARSHQELIEARRRLAILDPDDDGPTLQQACADVDRLMAEAVTDTVVFRFHALSRDAYNTLLRAHPPREDEARDAVLGYDPTGFYSALLRASLHRPAMTEQQWDRLDAVITDEQFDQLVNAVVRVNRAFWGTSVEDVETRLGTVLRHDPE